MTLIEIFSIIFIHWIADFVMQDEKWALGKSKNWSSLLMHTYTYSFIWLVVALIIDIYTMQNSNNWYFSIYQVQMFVLTTFIFHTITDYFTSRIVSKKFEKEAIFNMEVSKDIFKEGDIIEHGSNKVIIMKHLDKDSKVKLYYNSIPNLGAFTSIGLDQVLHYIQLFLTYYLLVK